jgi:amino-acid N-acetyltransferase
MLTGTRIRPATQADLSEIRRFLADNGLPTDGIERFVENFVIALDGNGSWIGTAGLELYGKSGLLRSVAVNRQFRGLGHGRTLVDAVLGYARAKGVETVYLFTETAEAYFKGLGFEAVGRREVDGRLKASPEFTECETAVAMRNVIG